MYLHSVQCMCNDSHFCPPGCHFLYILVPQFFGQSATNGTSTKFENHCFRLLQYFDAYLNFLSLKSTQNHKLAHPTGPLPGFIGGGPAGAI